METVTNFVIWPGEPVQLNILMSPKKLNVVPKKLSYTYTLNTIFTPMIKFLGTGLSYLLWADWLGVVC